MTEQTSQKVYIAGHTGLVGSALLRRFSKQEGPRVLIANRTDVDLTNSTLVRQFLERERPDVVVIAAARVGGISANSTYPAEFIYENLMIQANLIHSAWNVGVKRLLNFGSSCMYPKHCPQPMTPDLLMSGVVEPTSEPTAIAKLAGLTLCASYNRQYRTRFVTVIPCTLYGPGDSFDRDSSHFVSAMIRKFHDVKEQGRQEVTLWGSGMPRRDVLYVDDLAEACDLLLHAYEGLDPVNIGSGTSEAIRDIASMVADVVGFRGEISWDISRPDGAPDKRLDLTAIRHMGWRPRTTLREGLERTYAWFLEHRTECLGEHPTCASL